ncbi:MAG TPA: hydantoinase/carbamoylase family amidase [Burkholderiales bacterium]|nr:hydantoinase/carbamoylase family amidase [Burkholderiales bacterium]
MNSTQRLSNAVDASMPLAQALFDEVRAGTSDEVGVSREPYSEREQLAVDVLTRVAHDLDLEKRSDPFGNVYLTLAGADRAAPAWIAGSHVDSVPRGGNFDGFAGVVAGVTALAGFRRSGLVPPRDVTIMAIRAEELSSWYGGQHDGHIGSRAALGLLPAAELDTAINSRSGKTLRSHMEEAGADPAAVGRGAPYLSPAKYRGYLELHIEQGPVLEGRGIPVGVVTAIRGALRGRSCRCLGAYTHSGAVPHEYRSDAVMATVELVHALDEEWSCIRERGGDLVFTVGKFFTDSKQHALTKVPGETEFAIDLRSQDEPTLVALRAVVERLSSEIAQRRRVRFDYAPFSLQKPAVMDPQFRAELLDGCRELGITSMEIPSGAGHDAQDFVHAGFRAAMIFVRNSHGSHNPDESMDMADFALGARLLAWMLARD